MNFKDLNLLFNSITANEKTLTTFIICTAVSIVLGFVLAIVYKHRSGGTPSFTLCLAILPVAVQLVIMLVNGNLGAGVAATGAFSLVRFRSAPGSAKEIITIFLSMAIGLATGMGYVGIAVIFTIVVCCLMAFYTAIHFGEGKKTKRELKITIPEDIDYENVFEDIFNKYTSSHELLRVKTTNMGSLFQLTYSIEMLSGAGEKDFIDSLRCKNGNLEIVCSRALIDGELL